MRITPKSVQADSGAVHGTGQQSSRSSFVDLLASVSSAPVQRARNEQSQPQGGSNSDSGTTAHQGHHNQKSSVIQNQESSSATETIQRSTSETWPTHESNLKTGSTEGGSKATKDAAKTEEQESRKATSRKIAFTGQEGAPFNLQDSTMQAGITGMFSVLTTTVAIDVSAPSADATGRSLSIEPPTMTIARGMDTQAQFATENSASGGDATGQSLCIEPPTMTIARGMDTQAQFATENSASSADATGQPLSTEPATKTIAQGMNTQVQFAKDVSASSTDAFRQSLSTELATRTIAQGMDTQAQFATENSASSADLTGQSLSTESATRIIAGGMDRHTQFATNASASSADATGRSLSTEPASRIMAQGPDMQTQIGGNVSVTSADATGQSLSAQPTAGIVDKGTDGQTQTDGQNLVAVKDSDTALAAKVQRAVRQAEAQGGLVLDPASFAATAISKMRNPDIATSGNAIGDGIASQVVDSASAQQTSPAEHVGARTAMKESDSNSNQPAVTLNQSKVSAAVAGLKGDASKSDKNDDNGNGSSSSHSFDGVITQVQGTQSAGAQAAGVGNDASALQVVTATPHSETHDLPGSQTASSSAETAAHRNEAAENASATRWQGSEIAGMSGISAAKLIQNMTGTEMRVGMHSSEFGDISIRTSVSQQQMQTQISVDHNELGNALSAHIPSMQAKMGSDYGLHATIQVNQGGASFSNDGGRSQNHQHQATVPRIGSVESTAAIEHEAVSLNSPMHLRGDSRLDIRA